MAGRLRLSELNSILQTASERRGCNKLEASRLLGFCIVLARERIHVNVSNSLALGVFALYTFNTDMNLLLVGRRGRRRAERAEVGWAGLGKASWAGQG